jgi:hypothetical protein
MIGNGPEPTIPPPEQIVGWLKPDVPAAMRPVRPQQDARVAAMADLLAFGP